MLSNVLLILVTSNSFYYSNYFIFEENNDCIMALLLFTASRKQTSYKDRNVIEDNNDWIIFHSVSILCYTLCYINGSDG